MFKKIKRKPLTFHVKLIEKNAPYYKYKRAFYVHESSDGSFYFSEQPLTLIESSFYAEKNGISVVSTFIYDDEPTVEFVPEEKEVVPKLVKENIPHKKRTKRKPKEKVELEEETKEEE